MHTSHRIAITARQLQMPATTSGKTCAAGQRWQRQAAAKTKGKLHPSSGASIVTAATAKIEEPECQGTRCGAKRFGTKRPGRAAAWHVAPNSLPFCIGCFAAHARGGSRSAGRLARLQGGTAAASSPIQTPRASSTKARPIARRARAVPNHSFNASPNNWPGLPCLRQISYRRSHVMPGQLSGPR